MSLVRLGWIGLLTFCFLYLFVLQVNAIWSFTIDDMFITLRYAKHWAEGNGILWNIGAPPVEGYSNFSFLVLARIAYALHLNPVLVLKSTGVIGLFLLNIALFYLSRLWVKPRFALIPLFWLLGYCGEIIWSVSGLETSLYQALIVACVYFILKGLGYRAYPKNLNGLRLHYFVLSGVLLAIAGMTRPEASALMMLFVGIVGLYALKDARVWRGFFLLLGVLLACYMPYFIWRVHYFGHVFPNSVYCKGLVDVWNLVLNKHYLQFIWPFVLCALPLLKYKRDKGFLFLCLPSVCYLMLCIGADPIVAFYNRLFLPAFVLFLPLTLVSLVKMCHKPWLVYVFSGLFCVFFIPMMSLADYHYFAENPRRGEALRQHVVHWLDAHTSSRQSVVLADSGLIPYRSDLNFIDSYCLNNIEMSRAPSVERYARFCHEILLQKPDVVILTAWVHQGMVEYTPADACLLQELKHNPLYYQSIILRTEESEQTYYQYIIYSSRNSNTP